MTNRLCKDVVSLRSGQNPFPVLLVDICENTPVSTETGRRSRMDSAPFAQGGQNHHAASTAPGALVIHATGAGAGVLSALFRWRPGSTKPTVPKPPPVKLERYAWRPTAMGFSDSQSVLNIVSQGIGLAKGVWTPGAAAETLVYQQRLTVRSFRYPEVSIFVTPQVGPLKGQQENSPG